MSNAMGTPTASFAAILSVLVWVSVGQPMHWNNTWLMIMSTGASVVAFLMVFVVQPPKTATTPWPKNARTTWKPACNTWSKSWRKSKHSSDPANANAITGALPPNLTPDRRLHQRHKPHRKSPFLVELLAVPRVDL